MRLHHAAALLALAGCAVGPDYAPPHPALPDRYAASEGAEAAALSAAWWRAFGDATLTELVEQALARSPTLREAAARVVEARALRGVAAGAELPEITGRGSYSRSRWSEEAGPQAARFGAREDDLFDVGFDASWELDLFGRVRRSVEAAAADVAAAEADAATAELTLAAEVARRYVELRSATRRHALAEAHSVAQRDALALARARADAGVESQLPASQAESALAATLAALPRLAREADLARHQLATLLAVDVTALPASLAATDVALPPAPAFEAGVPSELVARRPDLRRAERELAAATARVGVATADLYPRLTLNGGIGLQSTHFAALGDVGSSTWSIGPDLAVPLFNNGRLRQALAAEGARAEQSLARFEQAVATALVEVEDALAAASRERERAAALAAARGADERTLGLSVELWTRGLTDYLAVTVSQRQLLVTQQEEVAAAAGELLAAIALCKALGGGA